MLEGDCVMIRPTMSHVLNKQNLYEQLSVYATHLESKIAELEKEMDVICVAVFNNRGKAVNEGTLGKVRRAVDRFNLPLDSK